MSYDEIFNICTKFQKRTKNSCLQDGEQDKYIEKIKKIIDDIIIKKDGNQTFERQFRCKFDMWDGNLDNLEDVLDKLIWVYQRTNSVSGGNDLKKLYKKFKKKDKF